MSEEGNYGKLGILLIFNNRIRFVIYRVGENLMLIGGYDFKGYLCILCVCLFEYGF